MALQAQGVQDLDSHPTLPSMSPTGWGLLSGTKRGLKAPDTHNPQQHLEDLNEPGRSRLFLHHSFVWIHLVLEEDNWEKPVFFSGRKLSTLWRRPYISMRETEGPLGKCRRGYAA
jgi:hypothetical protein